MTGLRKLVVVSLLATICAACEQTSFVIDDFPMLEARDTYYDGARIAGGETLVLVGGSKILRSGDGGTSWQVSRSGVRPPILAVAFRDDSYGAIVGAAGTYLETVDGGQTWKPRQLDAVDTQLMSIQFVNDELGFIVGEYGTVLRTESGGQIWTAVEFDWEQLAPTLSNALGFIQPHLFDVAFCNQRDGYVVGEYSIILSTRDGGLKWTSEHEGGLLDPHFFTVVCTDDGNAIVGGQNGELLFSPGRGGSWEATQAPAEDDIYGITALPQPGKLIAVGDLGTVLISEEGGRPDTWSKLPVHASPVHASNNQRRLEELWLASAVPGVDTVFLVGESTVLGVPFEEIGEPDQPGE